MTLSLAPTGKADYERRPGSIPTMDTREEHLLDYFKTFFSDDNAYRRLNMFRMARNDYFFQGVQDILAPADGLSSSAGGYTFERIARSTEALFPNDIDNRIAPGVNNFAARLLRKEYAAKVRPTSHRHDIEGAARVAEAALKYDIKTQRWDTNGRMSMARDVMLYGTSIAAALVDRDWSKRDRVASLDAGQCSKCEAKFASVGVRSVYATHGIPTEQGIIPFNHGDTLEPIGMGDEGPMSRMSFCPLCTERAPLSPYFPDKSEIGDADEGTGMQDVFGKQFADELPRLYLPMQVWWPFEVFPENAGWGIEPDECRIFGRRHVESVDWVESRHPSLAGKVEPQAAAELTKWDPMLSDRGWMPGGATALADVYRDHVNVYDLYIMPIQELPELRDGMMVTMVQDQFGEREPLIYEMKGPEGNTVRVPRAKISVARATELRKRFWGRTPVDDAIPMQRRLNQLDWQALDFRDHNTPFFAVPPGITAESRKDETGSYRMIEVTSAEGSDFDLRKTLVNAQVQGATPYLPERQDCLQALQNNLGPQEFEMGQNPTGVTAGTQLQILAEQVEAGRGPMERGLKRVYEEICEAHLQQTWAFRRDEAAYETEGETGDYDRETYTGHDLLGQCSVEVKAESSFDKTTFQSQAVITAYKEGLYGDQVSMDPVARDEVRDLFGAPDVQQRNSVQVRRANRAITQFLRDLRVPVVDETLDDAWIHADKWGTAWQGDDFAKLQKQGEWPQLLHALSGKWRRQLDQAMVQDAAQRAVYEGVPPEQWPMAFAQAQQRFQADSATYAQLPPPPPGPDAPVMPPPPQPPPPPPATGAFIPDPLQDKVTMICLQIVEPVLIVPRPTLPGEEEHESAGQRKVQEALVAFYATLQTYRLLDEQKKTMAAGGQNVMAAPGGSRTVDGSIPGSGGPVIPAQGTQPGA